jgi:YidC/Oxa1 family membrane protein insertase
MDRKTIVAIALCVLFLIFYPQILKLFGLDRYLYPSRPAPTAVAPRPARDTSAAGTTPPSGPAPGAAAPAPGGAAGAAKTPTLEGTPLAARSGTIERTYSLDTPLYHATFSDQGARLLAVELKKYVAAETEPARPGHGKPEPLPVVLAGGPSFAVDLGSGDAFHSLAGLAYTASESTDASGAVRRITFTAGDSAGFFIRQTWRVRPSNYALDLEVELRGVPSALKVTDYTLTTRSWPMLTEANQLADERALRASSLVGTNIHREHPGQLAKGPRSYDGNAIWSAVQTRYFLGGVAATQGTSRGVVALASKRGLSDRELAFLGPNAKPEQDVVESGLVMALPGDLSPVQRFVVYFGPSEYFKLSPLKVELERAVDLGWGWLLPFSKALLQLLIWIYAVVRNYGLAILILATLVRLVLHPLNLTSMKSMRAMQKLQPELARIKEKYKNDPQAFNTATMALYKENKVNPASGCLPMLVQMPLFVALYNVLYNAIELRRAPFVAWMQDLSAPDLAFTVLGFPVRLLPLLMAGSGLIQQSLTPTDPSQRPTMYMMNVVMLVFFYNLPSGLVLYWTVMNLLTALQQWIVLRQDGGPVALAPVPAPATGRGKRR